MNRASIVIPCCNAGAALDAAVWSALAQTSPAIEVVIVDGGSTDAETLRLLKGSNWPRTRIVRQDNAGSAAARNRAIRDANGEYIQPLDADDIFEPTYAAKAEAELAAVRATYSKLVAEHERQMQWAKGLESELAVTRTAHEQQMQWAKGLEEQVADRDAVIAALHQREQKLGARAELLAERSALCYLYLNGYNA